MASSPCELIQQWVTAATNRVRVARWIGENAVTFARREVVKAWDDSAARPRSTSTRGTADRVVRSGSPIGDARDAGSTRDSAEADGSAPARTPPVRRGRAAGAARVNVNSAATSVEAAATDPVDASPDAGAAVADVVSTIGAPFDGYDSLPAEHIVQRLARLAPDDLAGVRAYELAHRSRRTVVAKVDQLLDG